jgi:hypothetical protein
MEDIERVEGMEGMGAMDRKQPSIRQIHCCGRCGAV